MLHRLKKSEVDQRQLDDEIERLVKEIGFSLGPFIKDLYIFGSSKNGVESMHPYSDIDLCLILENELDTAALSKHLPRSKAIPVDWIVVNEADFAEKSFAKHGIYSVIAESGKSLKSILMRQQ